MAGDDDDFSSYVPYEEGGAPYVPFEEPRKSKRPPKPLGPGEYRYHGADGKPTHRHTRQKRVDGV